MKKNLFLIFIMILFFSASGFAYNASYSNLTVEQNGWCSGIDSFFKIYNKSQYDLYSNNKKYNFTLIESPKIKLYAGPFSTNTSLLLDTTASSAGNFSYKFQKPGSYLLEIYPQSGNFNEFSKILEIDFCKYSNPLVSASSNSTQSSVQLSNQSFVYGEIKVVLENTSITAKENLSVKLIENIIQSGLTGLGGVVKTFNLQGVNSNYSNMEIEVSFVSIESGKLVKGYYYVNNSWVLAEVQVLGNNVIFKNAKYGIYAITFEAEPIVIAESQVAPNSELDFIENEVGSDLDPNLPLEKDPLEDALIMEETDSSVSPVLSDDNSNVNPNLDSSNESAVEKVDETLSSDSNSIVMYVLVFLFVIVLGVILFKLSKNKTVDKTPAPEVLNSYNDIYGHVKKYVQTYKAQYGKDQIYRALETANVPRDIIDKVFLEEY